MSLAALGCNPNHTWTRSGANTAASPYVYGGDNPTSRSEPGALAYSPDGGMYRCIQASAALSKGEVCAITGIRAALVDTTGEQDLPLGICQAENGIASGAYGWVLVDGRGELQVGASAAANVRMFATSTGGQLDDAGTAGTDEVTNIYLTADRAASAGLAPCVIYFGAVKTAA